MHPIHFAADSPDKIIAALHGRYFSFKVKEEMQELLRTKRNVELFFAEEKDSTEKTKSR